MKPHILFVLLFAITSQAGDRSCGLVGDLETRVRSCSTREGAKKGNFTLVTRMASALGPSIYLDTVTNLLWTDINASVLPYDVAKDDLCASGKYLTGGIDSNWALPSVDQYIQVEKDGASTQDLSWWQYTFWTADQGLIYSTAERKAQKTTEWFGYFAQCVASADLIRSR